jgi:hypothetical protein
LETTRGWSEGPSGVAEEGRDSEESAIGGPPARGDLVPVPPSRAIVMPPITARTSTAAVTIRRMPWRNRISSSRAWMAARTADGRP